MATTKIIDPKDRPKLRCRIIPAGITNLKGKKQEEIGIVRYFRTEKEAEQFLAERPTGCCVLRVAEDAPETGKSPLIVSYRYVHKTFHRPLKGIVLRTKAKNDTLLCKTELKSFRFIQRELFGFLDRLTVFINEFCMNKHFIEVDMEHESTLEKELTIRKYIIFPSREHIVIMRRTDDKYGSKSISVSVDFNECKFFVIKNSGEQISFVNSFNDTLLEFLGIPSTHTFLVQGALGYNPKSLEQSVARDRTYSIVSTREAPMLLSPSGSVANRSKEKSQLLASIDLSLESLSKDDFKDFPDLVYDCLITIDTELKRLDEETVATKILDANPKAASEKLEWMKKRIFRTMLNVICFCGKVGFEAGRELPLSILRSFLEKNPMACLVFYEEFWKHMDVGCECTGLTNVLEELIDIESFRLVFLKEAGLSKLMTIYSAMSKSLFGQKGLLERLPSKANLGPRPSPLWRRSRLVNEMPPSVPQFNGNTIALDMSEVSEESDSEKEKSTPREESSDTDDRKEIKKPAIPLLKLPGKEPKMKLSFPSRSTRRSSMNLEKALDLSQLPLTPKETSMPYNQSPTGELKSLATRLGETMGASDLTYLISYKQFADVRNQRRLTRMDHQEDKAVIEIDERIKNTCQYKIKCNIVKTLAKISATPEFNKLTRNPVNILFLELTMLHKDKDLILKTDDELVPLIYKILQNSADNVETVHARHWDIMTAGMTPDRQLNFRRKLDLLLWRLRERVGTCLDAGNYDDASKYLKILADYMSYCYTRVMAAQVVEVFMEQLLKIKAHIFMSEDFVDPVNMKRIEIIHLILRIFDEIAAQNKFQPLNDLLLTLFVQKSETFDFIRYYSTQILSNEKFEETVLKMPHGVPLLRELRLQAVRHYTTCVDMIRKQYKSEDMLDELLTADGTKNELLRKLEFLLLPSNGIIMHYLAGETYQNLSIKREMCRMIHKVMSIKKNPFIHKMEYIEGYINFFYLHFIKFYNSYALDPALVDLSRAYLKILTDFAVQKNKKIQMKFLQLKVMDFLTYEVNLEYEVKIKRKKFTAELARQERERNQMLVQPPTVSQLVVPSATPAPAPKLEANAPKPAITLKLPPIRNPQPQKTETAAPVEIKPSQSLPTMSEVKSPSTLNSLATPKKEDPKEEEGRARAYSIAVTEGMLRPASSVPKLNLAPLEAKRGESVINWASFGINMSNGIPSVRESPKNHLEPKLVKSDGARPRAKTLENENKISARKDETKGDDKSSSGSEPSSLELTVQPVAPPVVLQVRPSVPLLRLGGEPAPTPAPPKVQQEAASPKVPQIKKPFVPKLSLDGAPPPNMSLGMGGSGSGEFVVPKPSLKLPLKREASPEKSPKAEDKDGQSPKASLEKKLVIKTRTRPKSMIMTLPSMEEREELEKQHDANRENDSIVDTNRDDLDKELENALAGLSNTTPKSIRTGRGTLDLDKELEATLNQLNGADDLDKTLQSLTDEMTKKDSARTDLDETLKSLNDSLESNNNQPKKEDDDSDGPRSAPLPHITPAAPKKKMAIPLLRLDDGGKRNSLPLSFVTKQPKTPKSPKSPKAPKTPKTPKTPKDKTKKSPKDKDKDKNSPKEKSPKEKDSSPKETDKSPKSPKNKDKTSPKDKTPKSSRGDRTPKDSGSPHSARKSPKNKSSTFGSSAGKKIALTLNLSAMDDGPKAVMFNPKPKTIEDSGDMVKKSSSNPAIKKFAIPNLNVVEKGLDYGSIAAEKEKGSQSPKLEKKEPPAPKLSLVPRLAVVDKADAAAAVNKPKVPKMSADDTGSTRKKGNYKEKRSTIHQDSFFKASTNVSKEHGDSVGDKIDWDFLGGGKSKDKPASSSTSSEAKSDKLEKSSSEKSDLSKLSGKSSLRSRKSRGSFSGSQTSASMDIPSSTAKLLGTKHKKSSSISDSFTPSTSPSKSDKEKDKDKKGKDKKKDSDLEDSASSKGSRSSKFGNKRHTMNFAMSPIKIDEDDETPQSAGRNKPKKSMKWSLSKTFKTDKDDKKDKEDKKDDSKSMRVPMLNFQKKENNENTMVSQRNDIEDSLDDSGGDSTRRPRKYTLTNMENEMNAFDPKFQVILGKQKAKQEEDEEQEQQTIESPDVLKLEEDLYQTERDNRKLYADDKLHTAILELIFMLLLSPNGFTLDRLYTDQFPMDKLKINVPFILKLHLNHPSNRSIIGPLSKKTQKLNESAFRILKLISTRFFVPTFFKDLERIAEGAYGQVYSCKMLDQNVAVKLMQVPRTAHDRCVLHDIFTEILILDKWKADERICKLLDYGVDDESYWIVMKKYKMSLKQWRVRQTKTFEENLPIYLNIFSQVLSISKFLTQNKVNHYDIKCDNFLIEAPESEDEEKIVNQPGDTPNFSVCLADFGESLIYYKETAGFTTDNRGTEFIKSPEMLTVAYAGNKERATYDRRKQPGANRASDVWSLGCLLYELLTGEFLFYDEDWVRFFIRVTVPHQELIPGERQAKLNGNRLLINFLTWVLIKEPVHRPTLFDVIKRFKYVKNQIIEELRVAKEQRDQEALLNSHAMNMSSNSIEPPSTPKGTSMDSGDNMEASLNGASDKNSTVNSTKDGSPDGPASSDGPGSGGLIKTKSKTALARRKSQRRKSIRRQESSRADKDKGTATSSSSTTTTTKKQRRKSTRRSTIRTRERKTVQKTEVPLEFDKAEKEYFILNPTRITNYMYLGAYDSTGDKKRLKSHYNITHIVNCTTSPNKYPDHFIYLQLTMDENTDITLYFKRYFDFVRSAVKQKGKILVCSSDGRSRAAAMVIALLMETKKLSYIEAYQVVHKRRYIVQIHPKLQTVLMTWGNKMLQGDQKEHFKCICGKCTWVLLRPFDKTEHQNPIPCSCGFEDLSDCPNHGCSNFLEEMARNHDWHDTALQWGTTTLENVKLSSSEEIDEFSPIDQVPRHIRGRVAEKDWRIYKCRTCEFITHAVSKTDPNVIALVTNIRQNKEAQNPAGSPFLGPQQPPNMMTSSLGPMGLSMSMSSTIPVPNGTGSPHGASSVSTSLDGFSLNTTQTSIGPPSNTSGGSQPITPGRGDSPALSSTTTPAQSLNGSLLITVPTTTSGDSLTAPQISPKTSTEVNTNTSNE